MINRQHLITDDEEVQDVDVIIDNGLLSDICGTVQAQTNFLNGGGTAMKKWRMMIMPKWGKLSRELKMKRKNMCLNY